MKNISTFEHFDLLISSNPCDIFRYYNVTELHGLTIKDCESYKNTETDAYIAGFCNLSPEGKPFLFINLSRCTDDVHTFALIFHEAMHLSGILFDGDWENREEEMITFAEEEAHNIFKIIKQLK
jgi:hypothetical protein